MMIEQLLKNILGDNGKTKIDINEIARNSNGETELLGDLVNWEIGENSNGTYFKHPSGLLICLNNFTRTSSVETSTDAGFYRSSGLRGTHAHEFASRPFVDAAIQSLGFQPFIYPDNNNPNTQYICGVHAINRLTADQTLQFYTLAIGLWK